MRRTKEMARWRGTGHGEPAGKKAENEKRRAQSDGAAATNPRRLFWVAFHFTFALNGHFAVVNMVSETTPQN